jgi:hypothetical protein
MSVFCKYGDEPEGSGATELMSYLLSSDYHAFHSWFIYFSISLIINN